MTNMKDLAKAAGVSLATISRVFNESEKVRPETREKVLGLAEKLNYRPNKIAAALRSGKSDSIGVVIPVVDREVFSSAIKSMEEVLSAEGYSIIISQSHESFEKEVQIIENLKKLNVAGVIISISKDTKKIAHLESLQERGTPIIFFDRTIELGAINSVVINNFNGAYQATHHLIEQGCKHIIHLAGKEEVTIFRERRRGFEAAIRDHQMPFTQETIVPFDDALPNREQVFRKILQSENRPDGILAQGDIDALVALRVMDEFNIQIPKDIAIVGFGDSKFCTYLKPSLSSVSQRNDDVGRLAATLLIEEMKSKEEKQVITQQMLSPILKIRASSKRI